MLYVASQPVFHLLSDEIEKLIEISKNAEEKDMYTHDHGIRLKDYSVRIGKKMNLSEKKLDVLYYTASFHDIGKIEVPDGILKKPGKLTPKEFELIKMHPINGEKMIKNTFLKECAEGIVQHHERPDGSGYPYGLKDKEICIEGKIIAVLDTYDAMISDRPYRKGVDPIAAIQEIKSLVGKHYDKNVVKYFEEILIEDGII
jgi:HD-GYP domain-containing protein (c-di-GMP phosphodiesterase class II)